MTVWVAALAEKSGALVRIADKALTHGDNIHTPAVQADAGIRKMLRIGKSMNSSGRAGSGRAWRSRR